VGRDSLGGALCSSGLALAAEALGLASNVNTIVIVALCGAAGAFFGALPKIIIAMSGSRSVLAKELRILLDRTHRLEQRIVLEQAAKHILQSEHNNAAIHVMNLEALLVKAGTEPPPFVIRSYREMLGPTDKKIQALMLDGDEEEG
jgi:hypothetical protein